MVLKRKSWISYLVASRWFQVVKKRIIGIQFKFKGIVNSFSVRKYVLNSWMGPVLNASRACHQLKDQIFCQHEPYSQIPMILNGDEFGSDDQALPHFPHINMLTWWLRYQSTATLNRTCRFSKLDQKRGRILNSSRTPLESYCLCWWMLEWESEVCMDVEVLLLCSSTW